MAGLHIGGNTGIALAIEDLAGFVRLHARGDTVEEAAS
jgi:hypothetical protein